MNKLQEMEITIRGYCNRMNLQEEDANFFISLFNNHTKTMLEGLRPQRAENSMKDPNDFGKFQEGYNQLAHQVNTKIDNLLKEMEDGESNKQTI